MFEQEFEKLNMADQEAFRRMVNWLLAHTYLLQGDYAFEDNMRRTNPDYSLWSGISSCFRAIWSTPASAWSGTRITG